VVTHATMLRTPRSLLVTLACLPLAAGLLAGGCGQGEGDRCEIDDDCGGGLVCVLNQQGRSDGTCRTQITVRPPDAAAAPDRMPADAPADTATTTDTAAPADTAGDTSTDGTVDGTTATVPDAGPDRGNG
jgi:hypothetical protein